MEGRILNTAILSVLFSILQCGQPYYERPNVRVVTVEPSKVRPFDAVKAQWTANFTLPDPLFKESDSNLSPFLSPPDLGLIRVSATLYGEEMIDAWVRKTCREESLSYTQAYEQYENKHHPEDQFRIELKLQSHFSEHSLEPELWTIYLEDDQDVMYEPLSVQKGEIVVKEKEICAPHSNFPIRIRQISRTIDLYFPRVTFFGKRLLSQQTKYLRLVFSYQKKPMGDAKWVFGD
ncbi:MAG: hypothetical protein DRQ02_03830 [Candidatus Latescibacterota bacterium]|nr:MAG: hypothetical protein DRQ02_03830 [Candidatus Latescibacterota bacterium]RKY74092.1 MAG: hypothetical protein DRQ24_00690 [Candidatus Latescibacterota bacterium]